MKMNMNRACVHFVALVLAAVACPAAATITLYISPGTTCKSSDVLTAATASRFTSGGAPVQIAVCMTTTTESVCGFTLNLESGATDESAHFQVVGRKLGPNYPDANIENMPAAIAIRKPMALGDLGGLVPEKAPPVPPRANQLLTTLTLAPLAVAKKATYSITFGKQSVVVVSKDGNCANPVAVPIAGSFRLDKN